MVSFQPSEEQQLIRDTVAAFAREQVRPHAHEADETGQVPGEVIQQGWDLGLVLSAIPEAYGGAGDTHSAVTGALLAEELAWGDLSIAMHLLAPRLLVYPVVEMGTEGQKQRILSAYTGAQFCPGSAAVMEPRFDFDLADLSATAERSNGAYVLTGAKCFVPLGAEAHVQRIEICSEQAPAAVEPLEVRVEPPGVTHRQPVTGVMYIGPEDQLGTQCRPTAPPR